MDRTGTFWKRSLLGYGFGFCFGAVNFGAVAYCGSTIFTHLTFLSHSSEVLADLNLPWLRKPLPWLRNLFFSFPFCVCELISAKLAAVGWMPLGAHEDGIMSIRLGEWIRRVT